LNGTAEDGSIVALTTTTDGNGRYEFEDVPRGTYTISEVLNAGWIQTCPAQPGTYLIIITNADVIDRDFGNRRFKVSGHKFNDTNGNGLWNPNEPGLAGWTIRLDGITVGGLRVALTATTDSNGRYEFEDVPRGTYTLSEILNAGWIQTCPAPPGTYPIIITNADVIDRDFGNRRFRVSGHKFNDTNGNGVWDPNEPALAGWTIRLDGTADDGSIVALTTTTDGNGRYEFEDVPRGTYTLSEILNAGWIQTCPAQPGTYLIIITNADVIDRDFGNRRFRVSGHKFNDINGNGVWDPNEPGLAGWTIRLDGTAEDGTTVSLTTTTDDNGRYEFEDVPRGDYIISEVLEAGWIQTCPAQPGTYLVTITNADVIDRDFGNRKFRVSGHKFNDINGNGVWDPNEPGLAGWTIKLDGTAEDGTTVSRTNITDYNGYYEFRDVSEGTYTLSELLKVGWMRTCPPPPGTHTIDVTDDDVLGKNFGNRGFIHYDENIIVGAPTEDVEGSKDQGRVYRFYGLTGKLRHTIDCPSLQPDALFGYSVSSGMVGSDYRDEIIVGAPGEGRVYTFYGATSKLHHTIDCPSPQPDALFGYSVSTGDVNGDGFDEIIVGAPYEDVGDNESQGRVYTFYALTGKLHHTIDCPSPRPGALFGHSVSTGDLNGDGFDEIIVGAPYEDVGDNESQGRVYTFYGLTSKLRHILDCPNPRPDASFGYSVNAVDLVSDYREEVIVGAPGEDVGDNESQGRVYTFYGATGKLHLPLNCTSPQSNVDFGHSLSVGDTSGDGLNDVIVGAPGEGRVYTFYGLTGKLRHTIDCPIPQPDALFGWSVNAGTVGSDYRDEVIVGAPGEDVGENVDQGRVYTFYGATSKLRHTLDTPNPQSGANFGWSVGVTGGFMVVTCSDPSVNIDHTQTSVTDDPVGEGYDFDVTFSSPVIESSVLHKLPAWTETPHTMIGPNTIQVQLDIIEGVLDPAFILAPVEGVRLPDLTLTSEDIQFIPTASTSTSSYLSEQTTLTKDIHKPKSAPNILKNVKSVQPYKEIISREVMSSSDTPTFTIENLTYPPTVNPNQTFQVTVDTNYSFSATTDIFVGIWDCYAGDYIAETPDNETLSGTGSKSYTFNLTAPASGIMDLSADACYWDCDFVYYRDFEVTISTQSFTIENLTYPATVNSNQIFQVTIATNYSFSATTDIFAGIWDRDASDYIAGTPKNETLSGTGSRSYTFNLTAPASGTMNISATLWYRGDHGDEILSDYRAFNVNVGLEEPDFTITAEPASQTVSQGDSAPYTISLTSLNGFNSPVTLSVSGLPTGATGIFNPNPVTPSNSSILTINTSKTTPTGNYTLTITGAGGEITHQTTVALNIAATGEGNITTISATIHNIGTADASIVTVQFFDGDPDAGGIQIGDNQTIILIPADGVGTVSVDWKISGHKFNDINGNGVWDPKEPALAGWTIRLDGTAEDGSTVSLTATTDGNGYYKFEDVPRGDYTLSEILEDGWIQTCPAPPGTYTFTIINADVLNRDFGNRRFVHFDENIIVGAPSEDVGDSYDQGRVLHLLWTHGRAAPYS
jgi:hypothetical protein